MSPWKIGILVFTGVVLALDAAAIVWMVLRQKDDNKHPENYKHKLTRKERRAAKKAKVAA